MNEIIIELEEVSPKEFFGAQNANIELLKKYFPKLKIVARGTKIKAYGDQDLLEEFDRRFNMLMEHYIKYNKLDENVIERVLTSQSKDDYTTSDASGATIVHGVNGRLIKAQTANQRKLVELMRKNDMVFAIGPAGTGKTYTGVALAVQALKNKEALTTVSSFKNILKRKILNLPEISFKTDNGSEFVGEFDQYLQKNKVWHKLSMPYRKRQMAPVEGLNGVNEQGKDYNDWSDILPQIRKEVNAYRERDLNELKSYQHEHFFDITKAGKPKYSIGNYVY